MSQRIEVLAEAAQALGLAAERLRTTHDGVSQWFPLTPLSIEQLPEASRERDEVSPLVELLEPTAGHRQDLPADPGRGG